MGWVGSANNMKWVGLGVNLMGWIDKKWTHIHVCVSLCIYRYFILFVAYNENSIFCSNVIFLESV